MIFTFPILLLALLIRLAPFLGREKSVGGVDHWYWCQYVKGLQEGKKVGFAMPNYLLEDGNWYPPLFPVFLSKFPWIVVEKYSHLLAIGIDLIRLLFLFVTFRLLGIEDRWATVIAGLLYATTPILVSYNTQLNPRGLGALMFDMVMVLFLWHQMDPLPLPVFWSAALVLTGLMLLTHKMTTQMFTFTLLCASLIFRQPQYLLLLPGAVGVALVLSGGFYAKTLRAHWDILKFWTLEWPLLGADPLRESPIYGRGASNTAPPYEQRTHLQTPTRKYRPGFRNFCKRLVSIFFGNYAPATSGALLLSLLISPRTFSVEWTIVWTAACLAFAILTIAVPVLRGLGFGNLYLYNAVFPAALLTAWGIAARAPAAGWIAGAMIGLNVVSLWRTLAHLRKQQSLSVPPAVLGAIQQQGEGVWICFPLSLSEYVTYFSGRPVLWGGHGHGFEKLRDVLPVVRRDFKDFMSDYGLRYVLTDDYNLSEIQRIPIPQKIRYSGNGYHVVELMKNAA
ncbi:MAG: hypothetical protein A2992_07930 [Elusimicrobia bacterium RIFCSPLOWO2_01_FULL_59_12]|nr:MAG: hypothetical protein A2992_07930 [Elusimicrobia bacterium RIFCSPLOWO2_01_FULL_59_12]